MNLKEIRELINLMNENDLTEVEVEREGGKIKLKKASNDAPEGYYQPPRPITMAPVAHLPQSDETVKTSHANTKEICSPMIGTFYRSPSPESPAFVEVGSVVEIGQVVCIVEAMKLMNEIKSEVRGKVVEISVENAQPVEFSQTLFVVEPV